VWRTVSIGSLALLLGALVTLAFLVQDRRRARAPIVS
jgi:hypothetical protein